jgi:hypothetical protein
MKLLVFLLCLIIFDNSLLAQTIVDRIQPVELFKPMIETGEIAGVVTLLATKDSIISLEAAGYSNIEKSIPITFRHLLNHTSGLPAEPPVQKGPFDRVLLQDIMPGYAYTHLKQDPNEPIIQT